MPTKAATSALEGAHERPLRLPPAHQGLPTKRPTKVFTEVPAKVSTQVVRYHMFSFHMLHPLIFRGELTIANLRLQGSEALILSPLIANRGWKKDLWKKVVFKRAHLPRF